MSTSFDELKSYKELDDINVTMCSLEFSVDKNILFYEQFESYFDKYARNIYNTYPIIHRNFTNAPDFLNGFWKLFDRFVNDAVNDTARYLFDKTDYPNANPSTIYKLIAKTKSYQYICTLYSKIADHYLVICRNHSAEVLVREIKKNCRGRFIGGGYGIEGTIKGAALAGTLNAAYGAAYSAVNFVGNISSEMNRISSEKGLIQDKFVVDLFTNCMINIVQSMPKIIYKAVVGGSIPSAGTSEEIFERMLREKPDGAERLQMYKQIFSTNPYDYRFYAQFFIDYGNNYRGRGGYVSGVVKHFECYEDFKSILCSTYVKECNKINKLGKPNEQLLLEMNQVVKRLHLDEDDEIYESVYTMKIESLDNLSLGKAIDDYRTIAGVRYATLEEATNVRNNMVYASTLVQKADPKDLESVNACIAKISALNIPTKDIFITQIKELYEEEQRKVAARKEAEAKLAEYKEYFNTHCSDLPFDDFSKDSYNTIKSALDDITAKYGDIADKEFVDKCKKYMDMYEEKQSQPIAVAICIIFGAISLVLTKKVWFARLIWKVLFLPILLVMDLGFVASCIWAISELIKLLIKKLNGKNKSVNNKESNQIPQDFSNELQETKSQEIIEDKKNNNEDQTKQKSGRIDFR